MAKSKKSSSTTQQSAAPAAAEPKQVAESAPAAAPEPKGGKGKKPPKKAEKTVAAKPAAPAPPMIDTNLAAAAAASMVAHRDLLGGAAQSNAPADADARPAATQTSSAFKQLKQGLNKPSGGVGSLLGTPPGQKKSNSSFGPSRQNFRNQTFGADVNRSGVPRRTSGG